MDKKKINILLRDVPPDLYKMIQKKKSEIRESCHCEQVSYTKAVEKLIKGK